MAEEELNKACTDQMFIHGEFIGATDLMTEAHDKHDQIIERLRNREGQLPQLQWDLDLAQQGVEDVDNDYLQLELKLEAALEDMRQAEHKLVEVTTQPRNIKGVIRDRVAQDAHAEPMEKLEKLKVIDETE